MMPRLNLWKLRSPALIAGFILSASICAASPLAADEVVVANATRADREAMRPAATFFTINAVLAKLDRERGRGPNAVRFAALNPSNLATDAPPLKRKRRSPVTSLSDCSRFARPRGCSGASGAVSKLKWSRSRLFWIGAGPELGIARLTPHNFFG